MSVLLRFRVNCDKNLLGYLFLVDNGVRADRIRVDVYLDDKQCDLQFDDVKILGRGG